MATTKKSEKPISKTTQSKESSTVKKKSLLAPTKTLSTKPPGEIPAKKAKEVPPKGVKKSPAKAVKKVPAKKAKTRTYSLSGDLTITTSPVLAVRSDSKIFKTPEIVIDSKGNMFTKTVLELTLDNRRAIAVLDAEQVEILLKLLRIAEYAD